MPATGLPGDPRSRCLIFFNKAPIQLDSKRHNTVDTSTFSSEFADLNTLTELVKDLRYKLRMFGIPIERPTNIICNNEAVYKNVLTPELALNKKNESIFQHKCR